MTLEWLQPLAAAAEQGGHHWSLRGAANREDMSPLLFWTYLGVSIALVTMAGMASGLTLGLMSLDELDLEVRCGQQQHHPAAASLAWCAGAAIPSIHSEYSRCLLL